MIALTKGPMPRVLYRFSESWTAELIVAIAAGRSAAELRKTKYNTAEIKSAIKQETNSKCAYCESDPMHVSYGDIEHIVPKSIEPGLAYAWENLTLACDVCNTKKGNQVGIIDPYSVEPADHLEFIGPMVRPKTNAGKLTCVALDLNRTKLLERRHEKLADLDRRWHEIESTGDEDLKNVLLRALEAYSQDAATEYSACVSQYKAIVLAGKSIGGALE